MTAWLGKTHLGDCRELLARMTADGVRVQTCVTSPPYWDQRDYGVVGQIGLESTPEDYIAELVAIFRCVPLRLRTYPRGAHLALVATSRSGVEEVESASRKRAGPADPRT